MKHVLLFAKFIFDWMCFTFHANFPIRQCVQHSVFFRPQEVIALIYTFMILSTLCWQNSQQTLSPDSLKLLRNCFALYFGVSNEFSSFLLTLPVFIILVGGQECLWSDTKVVQPMRPSPQFRSNSGQFHGIMCLTTDSVFIRRIWIEST